MLYNICGDFMKTYIFDFDGTLVDSMPSWADLVKKILDNNHIRYPDDIIRIITPLGNRAMAEYFITLGLNRSPEEILKMMDDFAEKEYRHNIPAKKGVKEKLEELKARGDSLNVLTASPHKLLDPCLKRLKLYDLFDNVWSCDDFATTKANPEIYTKVAQKLNMPINECIFADDNKIALKTAKSAGMKVVGVYDSFSEDDTEEIKLLSDCYITTFGELP